VPVPLDTSYTEEQVTRLLEDSGARLIVASARFEETASRARDGLDCASMSLEEVPERPAGPPPVAAVEPDSMAVILYTSGTTSDPKGVVLTHANLVAEIDCALSVVTIDESDAVLGVLPLFHALAQMANLLLPLTKGARVVFLEVVDTVTLLGALQERGISAFCCVPQFFYLIHERVMAEVGKAGLAKRIVFRVLLSVTGVLRERFGINVGRRVFGKVHHALGPRMKLLVTGGSRFDTQIGRDLFRLGFNILQAYGLTETSGAATALREGDPHVSSVGQALPDVEVKIVPGEYEGADAEVDAEVGEVAIRGPVVSPGYYRRDDVNAVTFRDGWLYTGDLGYLDPDGRLYITGRAKDVIVLGSGKNIYPEEIEAHYGKSVYIKELCVMGRAREGAPASERLHAVIVPDTSRTSRRSCRGTSGS
jgi:long-chain acyl-CoA synthetase